MVTLRDVAADAGVSISTASRVLTGARPVKADNARAVLESASRLGYRGHHIARSLRTQATQSVGVIVPVISNPFFPVLVQAIERALHHEHDLAVLLCDSQDSAALEAQRIGALLERQVDALLCVPCHVHESSDAIRAAAATVPVVQIDRWTDDSVVDIVSIDHAAGIRTVVEHLIGTGRHRLAYVGADTTNAAARTRATAFRKRLDDAGITPGPVLAGAYTIEWGREAAEQLLRTSGTPDAVVCGNDLIAIGVLDQLRAAGVAVPDDIALTGFDGIDFTLSTAPPLTTVAQPVERIAARTVELLLERIGGSAEPHHVDRFDGDLIVRESTAPDHG
ncbi:LacI family DNA-binding transcriptional regulator [soil metagenome]